MFLLTDTVPKLYEKFSIIYIDRNDMNMKIEPSEEFKESYQNTAHLMVKAIKKKIIIDEKSVNKF